jgi:hypothetical protein
MLAYFRTLALLDPGGAARFPSAEHHLRLLSLIAPAQERLLGTPHEDLF